jgi:predicted ATP-dependent Lon-type protease
MMRDGSYKRTFELRVGDSVMPFYQKDYGYNKHGFKRYRKLYNFSKGWQSEHKIVAEQFYRPLQKNEVVHHLDINGSNNMPDNLLIMDWKEHKKYHSEYNKNVLWSDKNYENQIK